MKQKPMPMRLIDKNDYHTQKTIEIIGKKRYKKLLKNGIITVSYETQQFNRESQRRYIARLRDTIRILSSMIDLQGGCR